MQFYHFYHPAMNIKDYNYPTRVCLCVLFCPADTVNPMILANRCACKPLSHDLWNEHVYRKKGRRKVYVACMDRRKIFFTYKFLVRNPEGQKPLKRLLQRLGNNITIILKEIHKVVDRAGLAQNRIQWQTFVNTHTHTHTYGKFCTS